MKPWLRASTKQERKCREKVALSRRMAERRAFFDGMRFYRCPICVRWHLTKLPAVGIAREPRKEGL
jgi:hypothetical protein